MSEWISVEDRLPERASGELGSALAYSPGYGIWIESHHPTWWNRNDERGRGRLHDGPHITHWMPLPEPPK